MAGNYKKDDLRVLRTHRYLRGALQTLLERRSFRQLTVNDICEHALLSRAAFYTHFQDKYDLLRFWLNQFLLTERDAIESGTYFNNLICSPPKWLKNLIKDSDSETMDILHNYMSDVAVFYFKKLTNSDAEPNKMAVTFCAGGMISLVSSIISGRTRNLSCDKDYFGDIVEYVVSCFADIKCDIDK